jgi:phospholipid-binding lipoprotein MlaA
MLTQTLRRALLALACSLAAVGCAARESKAQETEPLAYAARALAPDAGRVAARAAADWDPLEPLNRAIFALNGGLDTALFQPLARGWKAVTPQGVRDAFGRVSDHLQYPAHLLGCLTQGRLLAGGQETARFAVNSTVGLAGLFDPAARISLRPQREDLGRSLGRWGVGPGPYLVLPLIGPSAVRDLLDVPLRSAASALPPLNVIELINGRAAILVQVDTARAASVDLYLFARSTYLRGRRRVSSGSALEAPPVVRAEAVAGLVRSSPEPELR